MNTWLERKKGKGNTGITLIALVITIVVLLILASITISALSGNNGIIKNAAESKRETEKAEIIEQIRLKIYEEMTDNMGEEPDEEDVERIAGEYGTVTGDTFEDKILKTTEGNYDIKLSDIWTPVTGTGTLKPGETATDEKNEYYDEEAKKTAIIPKGFTVSDKAGETSINGGLVVYAPNNDEYVWVPVDGILGENGKTVQSAVDGEIILGRYVFKEDGTIDTDLTPTTLDGQIKAIYNGYYTEDITGNEKIKSFIQSVRDNGGYYIGRYEAGIIDDEDNFLTVVKKGQYVNNNISQTTAIELCQNLYENVNSDLTNSYACDTAILFIQKYSGDIDYSRQTSLQSTLAKTGEATDGNNNDIRCNIYDMAGNCFEWTTECCDDTLATQRGGAYTNLGYNDGYTAYRYGCGKGFYYQQVAFRPILYN